jgi:hypothetical protein
MERRWLFLARSYELVNAMGEAFSQNPVTRLD